MLLSNELMSCCAAGTNACLDLREHMSRLHDTACQKQRDSFSMKLSKSDAREDRKVIHWCRTQASSHSLQSVVDGKVNESGVSTAVPDRSAVLWF